MKYPLIEILAVDSLPQVMRLLPLAPLSPVAIVLFLLHISELMLLVYEPIKSTLIRLNNI
jgi:hypothetical protein